MLDPTFGLFFYSKEQYDGTGEIVSFYDLVMAPDQWTAFKVVERPWIGRYDDTVRAYGVAAAEADYLKDVYRTSILELYGKYAAETFPIAYGHRDPVSYPVDADLREREEMRVGEVDGNNSDVLRLVTNGSDYVGGHYLGGSYPPGFHTWSIRTPGPCRLRIEYFSTQDNPPALTLVSVEGSANCLGSHRGQKGHYRPSGDRAGGNSGGTLPRRHVCRGCHSGRAGALNGSA